MNKSLLFGLFVLPSMALTCGPDFFRPTSPFYEIFVSRPRTPEVRVGCMMVALRDVIQHHATHSSTQTECEPVEGTFEPGTSTPKSSPTDRPKTPNKDGRMLPHDLFKDSK